MAVLKSPLTSPLPLKRSALVPTAVFCVPLLLSNKAAAPTAVLESMVFNASAPPPTPVLKLPMVLTKSARQPSRCISRAGSERTEAHRSLPLS